MRVALSVSIIVGIVLVLFIAFLAMRRTHRRRMERLDLISRVNMLQNVVNLFENEVDLQERAGYFDVTPFRHILNDHKELLP